MELTSVVNGVVVPARVGGHPALDLCNTYAGWADPPDAPGRGDYLVDYDALAEWTGAAGLLAPDVVASLRQDGRRHPRIARRVLAEVIALRAAVHAVVTEPVSGRSRALQALETAAHTATARATLVPGKGWRPGVGLQQPVDACALAAVALLGEVALQEVHACPADGCGWLFHDPAGRRRWCRMEWCGNRIKQRAHAARSRQSRSARS